MTVIDPTARVAPGAVIGRDVFIGPYCIIDADVTIGLLRHFLIHNPQASVNPAVASSAKGYLKLQQARLRTLQRTLKRPWRRVAGKRFRGLLARSTEAL